MVLSRSIDDRKLAEELRGAAKANALNLEVVIWRMSAAAPLSRTG